MSELRRAKELLRSGGYTCVVCKGEEIYTSELRGVKPIADLLAGGVELCGASAADKVVGKATAFLYCLMGARSLYAAVISEPALRVLAEAGIAVEYDTLVPNIINRRGDGICPFELAVLDIDDAEEAYAVIIDNMRKMNLR